ncbi:MAG: formimidoylglutamase [Bacteroidia bacterium]|nr:formimidoylglutamase [Bacteroidia bacterium]
MKDISVYFRPVSEDLRPIGEEKTTIAHYTRFHSESGGFPDLDGVHIAVLGVEEDRGHPENAGCAAGADAVRPHFYSLRRGIMEPVIADLGNILAGAEKKDTYFALQEVINELLRKQILPVILGGSQDLSYANYLAYENVEPTINVVSIDHSFDLGTAEDSIHAGTWLGKVILHQPNHLFNFSNIGYQSYFVDEDALNLMAKLYFDSHRLGQMQSHMEEAEPVIRHADMLTVDLGCLRMSDSPGHAQPHPNGFYGEELCRIARYAGMSDKLTSIGFYEYNPSKDRRQQSAMLLGQALWYFLEGYYSRKKDYPFRNTADYQKYHVAIKDQNSEIIFYKSLRSDRWWMEVPYPPDKRLKVQRHCLVPCSYSDYQTALGEEVPDRWWQTFQKLG